LSLKVWSSSSWAGGRWPPTDTNATKDLDLFVRASPQNAPAVLRSLERFGAPLHGLDATDFATPGIILQVGAALRIDVSTTIDGVDFDEASVGRVPFDVDGATVFAICFEPCCTIRCLTTCATGFPAGTEKLRRGCSSRLFHAMTQKSACTTTKRAAALRPQQREERCAQRQDGR
jgi:hypothetical protein